MSLINQTTRYTVPGRYTYSIPKGISTVEFFLWGAGGADGTNGPAVEVSAGSIASGVTQTGNTLIRSEIPAVAEVDEIISGSDTFNSSGRWTVPPRVTSINVSVAGGGGGGAGGHAKGCSNNSHGGGNGGGGYTASGTISVSPGQVINFTVGSGGSGGLGDQNGGAGGTTSFAGVSAGGGNGGVRGTSGGRGANGSGGSAGNGGAGGIGNSTASGGAGSPGGSGSVTISWAGRTRIPGVAAQPAVYSPVYTTQYTEVFKSVAGGEGGNGGGGGYAYKKIRVSAGDEIVIAVGGPGTNYAGGSSLSNYQGGNAGVASNAGRGGGGGGATVVTLNGTVIAVAAGGGGGGGGGVQGINGSGGTAAITNGVGSGTQGLGLTSSQGPATGGGGGGGYFSGTAGHSGTYGGGGQGGISYGSVIESGSGRLPGGSSVSYYPRNYVGHSGIAGAAVLVFSRSFNIDVKKPSGWKSIDRAWVKVSGEWKEILNGWTKVSGSWQPLISNRSILGAEDLANPVITYSLAANVAAVDEGQTVAFTLSTTGLGSGNVVPYTATGISASELLVGSLSGNFIVGTTNTITFRPRPNNTTNGTRTLRVYLDNTTASANCVINDTSLTAIYTVSGNVSSIDEGQSIRYTLSNVGGIAGEVIPYNITGISPTRISYGSLSGNFVVGSAETVDISVGLNYLTEGETFMRMDLVGQGAYHICTVNDTSTTPIGQQEYTSGSGVWTVPTGVRRITIDLVGGGGGGSSGSENDPYTSGGGGGGSGGRLVRILNVTPGDTFSYTVGAGGAAGDHSLGTAGQNTVFGPHIASGGGGARNRITTHHPYGGGGGLPDGVSGNDGAFNSGDAGAVSGGKGGAIPGMGVGGSPGNGHGGAGAASGYGAGGGGGGGYGANKSQTQGTGTAGTNGYILISWS